MHRPFAIGVLFAALVLPTASEARDAPSALFAVEDVDRRTVPAGTPHAFWAAFGPSPRNEAVRDVDGQQLLFVALALIPMPDGRSALVSTATSDCTGHACTGANAIHYLDRQADGVSWGIDGEWLDVGATGNFGNPAAAWGWTDAIASAPVLYTEGGGVWQGYACSTAILTELAPDGPRRIASIPIRYSNTGAVEHEATSLDGRITSAVRGESFTVTYTGSRSFTQRYVRDASGEYRLAGRLRVPRC